MIPTAVSSDMRRSMNYIQRYKGDLLKAMRASELIACEGSDEEVAKHLDMSCGIDYISVSLDGKLSRGVGCRFQADVPYRTFTIRKERKSGTPTEFEKRKIAIERGGLYPYLTLHAYVDTKMDCITRLAIAKTEELIKYCEVCNPPIQCTGSAQIGQAEFYVVDWLTYKHAGNKIFVWENPNAKIGQMDIFSLLKM